MSLLQKQNVPTHINGEEIISIVQGKKFFNSATFQGMIDRNDYLYNEEENRYHLGLLSSWGMQGRETYPMISKLLERGSELKVEGFFGEFTYDKPFYDPKQGMKTVISTVEEAGDYPGIDESEFDIVLSEKCYPGDIIGTDPYGDEEQLYVQGCEASTLNGEGWRTTVTLTSGDPEKYYNPAYLDKDINYYKINHVAVEYTTQFTGVDGWLGQPTGSVRARFKLGGVRGVEGYVTGFADAINQGLNPIDGKDNESEQAMGAMQAEFGAEADANTVIFGKPGDIPNYRATALMEFLVERSLTKRTATAHLWQRKGQIKSTNGAIAVLNEGVWHQLRRGKIITIPKVGGLTKAHVAEAVNYVYKGSPKLDWQDREIMFEVGKLMENNFLTLFQNEIQQQLQSLQSNGVLTLLFGDKGVLDDRLRNQLVTGSSLNELQLASLLRFVSVPLIGIAGKVTIKHNPALDHLSGNPTDFRGQLQDGYDWTSHSAIIWDVTDVKYSNSTNMNVTGATTLKGDSKITDNLYLVRPEEGMLYKGQENGRWDRGKTSNIISSSRVIGQGFWAFNSSAQWMPHPDRVVMIELAKGARRQGLTPFSY